MEGVEWLESEKVMEARSFGVDASTEKLRNPASGNKPTKQQEMAQKGEAEGK